MAIQLTENILALGEHRPDAHVLIAFLAYSLQVTLKNRVMIHGPPSDWEQPFPAPNTARGNLMEEAMTIHLRPEIAAGLSALAAAHGTSVEDYLTGLIEKELPVAPPGTQSSDSASGMVWEDGLLIYDAGTPLPPGYIDNALRLSREQRSQRILGCSD